MNPYIIKTIAATALALCVSINASGDDNCIRQRFYIRPNASISLGNTLSMDYITPSIKAESSGNDYGVDFGYCFLRHGQFSMGANIGIGISTYSITMSMSDVTYSYQAGAEADMDGDSYIRHYDIAGLHQKLTDTYLSVPLYVDLRYSFSRRIAAYAIVGVTTGIHISGDTKSFEGQFESWGVYPSYGNLAIAEPWLNEFGSAHIGKDRLNEPECNHVIAGILAGAGIDIWLTGPLSVNAGVVYRSGINNIFKENANPINTGHATASTAPVTYTVASGQTARTLTDGLTKSKPSHLALNLGLTFRF
ncbi:MAG: outer membrane beta-barrel protein [Muribaculaceae bacterium]|nr:outer membrane beta-barrel protein [Muribaculaceae bacterium]